MVHRVPDLDAVACVVAAGAEPADVLFLPVNMAALPDGCEDALVLDHPLGRPRQRDGWRSVLGSMPEAEDWDPDLLAEVEDSVRRQSNPRYTLAEVLAALRSEAIMTGMVGRQLDRAVLKRMGRVVRGLIRNHEALREAARQLQDVEVLDLGDGVLVAVIEEDLHLHTAGGVLGTRGIAASIWKRGSCGLGVTRHRGFDRPDLSRLRDGLPGWHVPGGGSIACWGSSQAPVDGPPPNGTPQTVRQLARLVEQVFCHQGNRR